MFFFLIFRSITFDPNSGLNLDKIKIIKAKVKLKLGAQSLSSKLKDV